MPEALHHVLELVRVERGLGDCLDRNFARDASIESHIDDTHAAFAEHALDFVLTYLFR